MLRDLIIVALVFLAMVVITRRWHLVRDFIGDLMRRHTLRMNDRRQARRLERQVKQYIREQSLR